MNLFFTGMKHSGKTTFAKRVAQERNKTWADSDDLILNLISPLSVREYYKRFGKEAFLLQERKAVNEFINSHDDFVLSLGGGICDNTPVMELMKEHGKLIYLSRPEELLFEKIKQKGLPPFLDTDNPRATFHELFLRRDKIYRYYLDLEIELGPYSDKDQTLNFILNKLEEKYGR